MGLISLPKNYPNKLSPQLQEVVEEVLLLTRRPNLFDTIVSRVLATTLILHRKENFAKDVRTHHLMLTVPSCDRTVPSSAIPDCRKMLVIRANKSSKPLHKNTVDQALEISDFANNDSWSFLGLNYRIRTSRPHQYLDFVYLAKPVLVPEKYNSWLAAEHKDLLIAEVSQFVFEQSGDAVAANGQAMRIRNVLLPQLFSEEMWSDSLILTDD